LGDFGYLKKNWGIFRHSKIGGKEASPQDLIKNWGQKKYSNTLVEAEFSLKLEMLSWYLKHFLFDKFVSL